jgi:hypothetical protein
MRRMTCTDVNVKSGFYILQSAPKKNIFRILGIRNKTHRLAANPPDKGRV